MVREFATSGKFMPHSGGQVYADYSDDFLIEYIHSIELDGPLYGSLASSVQKTKCLTAVKIVLRERSSKYYLNFGKENSLSNHFRIKPFFFIRYGYEVLLAHGSAADAVTFSFNSLLNEEHLLRHLECLESTLYVIPDDVYVRAGVYIYRFAARCNASRHAVAVVILISLSMSLNIPSTYDNGIMTDVDLVVKSRFFIAKIVSVDTVKLHFLESEFRRIAGWAVEEEDFISSIMSILQFSFSNAS